MSKVRPHLDERDRARQEAAAEKLAKRLEADRAYRELLGVGPTDPLPKSIGNTGNCGRPPFIRTPTGRRAITGWYGQDSRNDG